MKQQGKVRMLVMDVDGTLTDGGIYIGAEGEMMKAFHVQDGYAIANVLPVNEIIPVIITGRKSKIMERRAAELRITHLHQGISDKLTKLKEIAVELGVSPAEIAYIGDDVNDLACIHWCGFSGCPADAVPEVLAVVDYVCKRDGGRGAVREFIDTLVQGRTG